MKTNQIVAVGLAAPMALLVLDACSASGTKSQQKPSGAGGSVSAGGAPSGGAGGVSLDGGGTGGISGTGASGGTGGGGPTDIDDCPGPLDAQTLTSLEAGGPLDPAMRFLYPYSETVFPRGMLAPVLQWAEAAGGTTAGLLRLTSNKFSYRGCFTPTAPGQLAIPQNVWEAATGNSEGAGDPLMVELTTLGGGGVSGPLTAQWTVALASIKGAIYYNTYNSPQNANNGAVMKLLASAPQPTPYLAVPGLAPLGPCVSCHSLSANGAMMVAAAHAYPAGPYTSASYDIASNPNPNPPPLASNLDEAGFAGVFPDGSRFMTTGTPSMTTLVPFPAGPGNVVGMVGPKDSRLFDTATGAPLPAPGWDGVIQFAKMPMFAPNGDKIVFNHHEDSGGRSLAVMDFDPSTNTFSAYDKIYQDAVKFPCWPFFTPDSAAVVFALSTVDDCTSAHPARPIVASSDLWYVDLATKTARPLARAGGFNGATPYLPYPGRDEHWEFFPTVSPVAAGGYFWVFFTSRRNYGNTTVAPVEDVKTKKIWVTALDIDPAPGADPSHPAFLLPGQELDSGNIRAFAALEPCRADGEACSTGIDCCCGACNGGACGCPEGCSNLDEKCETSADCCDPALQCLGGFCAFVVK